MPVHSVSSPPGVGLLPPGVPPDADLLCTSTYAIGTNGGTVITKGVTTLAAAGSGFASVCSDAPSCGM